MSSFSRTPFFVTRVPSHGVAGSRPLYPGRVEKLRSWVQIASILMLGVYIARFIVNSLVFDFSDRSFSIPFSIGVAYCGIAGSYRMHRDTLTCFNICCLASVFLYVINGLLQARSITLILRFGDEAINPSPNRTDTGQDSQGKTMSPETYKELTKLYAALLMETVLVIIQCSAAHWGRELVRDYMIIPTPFHRGPFENTISLEFIQSSGFGAASAQNQSRVLEQRRDLTIRSIPVVLYQKASKASEDRSTTAAAAAASTEASTVQSNALADVVSDDDEELCVICQDDFADGDRTKVLPCKHFYHAHCLESWLKRSMACPMCMREVPLLAVPDDAQPPLSPTNSRNRSEEASRAARNMVVIV